jgi:DNA-binding CsgD family transcriptional regulator
MIPQDINPGSLLPVDTTQPREPKRLHVLHAIVVALEIEAPLSCHLVKLLRTQKFQLVKILGGDDVSVVDALEAVLRDRVTKEYRHDLASNRPLSNLSHRQIQTLQLVSDGKTNAQIAALRGTTVRAVEGMLTRIFEAMEIDPKGSNPRVEASSRYHQLKSQVETVA